MSRNDEEISSYLQTTLSHYGVNDHNDISQIANIVQKPKSKSMRVQLLEPYLGQQSDAFVTDFLDYLNGNEKKPNRFEVSNENGKNGRNKNNKSKDQNSKNKNQKGNTNAKKGGFKVVIQNTLADRRDNRNDNRNDNRQNGRNDNKNEDRNDNRNTRNNNKNQPKRKFEGESKPFEKKRRVDTPAVPKLDHSGTRCKFFPNCSKEDCPFFHPTEPCALFPKCPKGANECLYLHPQIPCTYGSMCLRPGCAFTHPIKHNAPCKNGFACPDKMTTCGFNHGAIACRFGSSCTRGAFCSYSHATPCNFGAQCHREGCHFAHVFDIDAESEKATIPQVIITAGQVEALSNSLPPSPEREVGTSTPTNQEEPQPQTTETDFEESLSDDW